MKLQVCINGSVVFEDRVKEDDEFSVSISKGDVAGFTKFTEETLLAFDEARRLYPGKKRGNNTEFINFKKKHKDWKECLPLLSVAIINQLEDKKRAKYSGRFVPEWANFQTWINQRRWEEETVSVQTTAILPNALKFKTV